MKVDITVTGWPQLLKTLETLPIKMRQHVYKRAAEVGGRAIRDSIRGVTPTELGILKQHIVAVPRSYKRGEIRMAIVGPQRKVRVMYSKNITFDSGGRLHTILSSGVRSPSKYAHLVNDGFYSITAKRHIPGKHFMERGTRAGTAKAQRDMERVVTAGIMASAGGR